VWFAALWDRVNTSDEGEFKSFTILTGPSEGHLSRYHDRAPVILEPDEFAQWVDPSENAAKLMAAVRPDRFTVAEAA